MSSILITNFEMHVPARNSEKNHKIPFLVDPYSIVFLVLPIMRIQDLLSLVDLGLSMAAAKRKIKIWKK